MASNPAATLTSTLQSLSLNRAPSPTHDLNPSTASSQKRPVRLSRSSSSSNASIAIREVPRRGQLPPLPDLRFEQSYLASLAGVSGWEGVLWVTGRDQVLMPLLQGTLWTLALAGWRFWNRTAQFSGGTVGGRVRRWWWGVNDWEIPKGVMEDSRGGVGGEGLVGEVEDFYTGPFAAGGGD